MFDDTGWYPEEPLAVVIAVGEMSIMFFVCLMLISMNLYNAFDVIRATMAEAGNANYKTEFGDLEALTSWEKP
jgi:hypothetical protein